MASMLPPLSVAFWNYDRTMPIADGRVPVEGWNVRCEILRPQELFPRAFGQAEFDVSELSFTRYVAALSRGDRRYTAIPVFLSRSFRHASIYIRSDRGIQSPRDLAGRVLGVNNFDDTAAVVVRGMLREDHGIAVTDITWCIGDMEVGQAQRVALPDIPAQIRHVGADGRTLDSMLADGDIDGVIAINPPPCFQRGAPHVVRLFPDWRAAERDWFCRTGVFPIMHLIGVRTSLLDASPELASTLYDVFCRAKNYAVAELEVLQASKTTLPWVAAELADTRALMGHDFWPYGCAANRHAIEAGYRYCLQDGLLADSLDVESFFAAALRET